MAAELFGPQIAPYAAVACVTSFLMVGHRSVYPSQVLLVSKSMFSNIDIQKEIGEIQDMRVSTPYPDLRSGIMEFIQKRKNRLK